MQLKLFNVDYSNRVSRKYIRRKLPTVHMPSQEQRKRFFKLRELYEKYGTLQEVANQLGLTRERVRQLLTQGEKYGIIKYKLHRITQLEKTAIDINRDSLVKSISEGMNKFEICNKYKIDINTLERLLKYHVIDMQVHVADARYKRCLREYSKIVDILGAHPSATEMQARVPWRALYARIERLWGGIEEFRASYGIDKPKYALHPNTIKAFNNSIKRRKNEKMKNVEQVYQIINTHDPITLKEICAITKQKNSTVANYVQILMQEGKIKSTNSKYRFSYYSTGEL